MSRAKPEVHVATGNAYRRALVRWLAHPGEAALRDAYEIGRRAAAEPTDLLDVVAAHHAYLAESRARERTARTARDAGTFLLEALSPASMLLQGFADTVASLRALNRDLEERVAARTRELQSAEERYRTLVEQSPGVVFVHAEHRLGRPIYVSPRVEALLGIAPEDWMADSEIWRRQVAPEDLSAVMQAIDGWGEAEVPLCIRYRFRVDEVRTAWIREESQAFVDRSTGKRIVQGLLLDITEQHRLEERNREAHRFEMLGQMVGGIAHDFNNLLGVVLGNAEYAMFDDAESQPLRRIRDAANMGARLTRKLLAFSRQQQLAFELVPLNDLIAQTEGLLRPALGAGIELRLDLHPEAGVAWIDRGQMEQVVLNLCLNARDAMASGGRISIRTEILDLGRADLSRADQAPGPFVRVSVSDTGAGIAPDVVPRIFEPYFTTKAPGKGTGLGLATCHGIVAQSGGHFEVESTPGEGATFRFYLPRVEHVREIPDARERAVVAPSGEAFSLLVVEDEPGLLQLEASALRRHGFHVLTAHSVGEASSILAVHPGPIDALVTDTVLPGGSGIDLAKRVRMRFPGIPVVRTSGTPTAAADGSVEPPETFLPKPFALSELAEAVHRILKR